MPESLRKASVVLQFALNNFQFSLVATVRLRIVRIDICGGCRHVVQARTQGAIVLQTLASPIMVDVRYAWELGGVEKWSHGWWR
jgi:hypothetical protein